MHVQPGQPLQGALTQHATGTFEVKIQPQGEGDVVEGSSLARLSLEKRFSGDLEAAGKGEMLAARSEIPTSAAYVAERVSGRLHGREGSFVLVHKGVMTKETQDLTIEIAPIRAPASSAACPARSGSASRAASTTTTSITACPTRTNAVLPAE